MGGGGRVVKALPVQEMCPARNHRDYDEGEERRVARRE